MSQYMLFFYLATLLAALLATCSAQVSASPDRLLRYPYAKQVHVRRTRGVQVDPQTGAVRGSFPAGGGVVYGKVEGGTTGEFGYKHNVFNDGRGRLDASGYHVKDLSSGAGGAGGRLDWAGQRGGATVDVNRVDRTWNAAGGGRYNFNKDWSAGVDGTYRSGGGAPRDYGVRGSITGRW